MEKRPFQPAGESSNERKENFADFGLEIGDRIYTKSGTYREVKDIVADRKNPNDGYVIVNKVTKNGELSEEEIEFIQ